MRPTLTNTFLPILHGMVEELAEAHSLFWLSAANNQDVPVLKYFEADVTILGFRIPSVEFLMVKDSNTVLEPQHSTQLPGVIRCNLIWLGCEEFGKVFGFEAFKTFKCPNEVHPLVFAQMCTLYHHGTAQTQSVPPTSNSQQSNSISVSSIPVTTSEINFEIKREDLNPGSETALGQVWVGSPYKAICILANSVKVVKGKTSKIARRFSISSRLGLKTIYQWGSWLIEPQLLPQNLKQCL